MLQVYDARRMFGRVDQDEQSAFQDFLASRRVQAARAGVQIPDTSAVVGDPVEARVHQNRWIVDCPDCPGAEMAWLGMAIFMCTNCWNGGVMHMWRPVTIPDNWQEIEGILRLRPAPENRNWYPEETTEQLIDENLAHGIS